MKSFARCPLDRCNNGNILSSHTVEVDAYECEPSLRILRREYGRPSAGQSFPETKTSTSKSRMMAALAWSSPVQINNGNSGTGGRRFQLRVSVTQGTAYVSCLDRRASISGSNDLTDYYAASASDIRSQRRLRVSDRYQRRSAVRLAGPADLAVTTRILFDATAARWILPPFAQQQHRLVHPGAISVRRSVQPRNRARREAVVLNMRTTPGMRLSSGASTRLIRARRASPVPPPLAAT